jgi:hypothetical protein
MKQDLLSYESQTSVVDVALLSVMMVKHGEEEGLYGLHYASGSQHSMSATRGP